MAAQCLCGYERGARSGPKKIPISYRRSLGWKVVIFGFTRQGHLGMAKYLRMVCKYCFATLYDQGYTNTLTTICSSINLRTMTMIIIGGCGY